MGNLEKELLEQSGATIKEVYKDLISPSVKPVGTVLSLLPRTIRLSLQKWEKWVINGEESLRLTATVLKEKVNKIPEEKLCEPEPYVAVPAIQQIAYCWDSDELRDMYANLLAASMNLDKKWSVHPGYVDIIKQLTPDEAKILRKTSQNNSLYNPIVDIILDLGNGNGEVELLRNYSNIGEEICEAPDQMGQYFDNLYRLRLIDIPEGRHIMNDSTYDEIRKSSKVTDIMKSQVKEGTEIKLRKKYFFITDFGMGFLECCLD